jgi:hypothetical protein
MRAGPDTLLPMRRLIPLIAVAAVGLAGCGSSSSGSSNPLNTELSYFPSNSPFVMSIQTDPNSTAIKQTQQLVNRFPVAGLGESAAKSRLSQVGINYDADLKPLFGNPVMFGLGGGEISGNAQSQFLAVWVTKDQDKLNALLNKVAKGVQSSGTHGSAKLYPAGSATLAIDGATLIIGASQSIVTTAIDRHSHGGGVTSSQYTSALAGLPQDALVDVFGSIGTALQSPGAAKARQIPWVAALKSYGVAVSASTSGLSFQYHLDTTGGSLTSSQLPIASGSTPPNFAGDFPIVAALHDPSQTISFIQSAAQVTGGGGYQDFLRRQAAAKTKTGTDLTSLFSLLTGNAVVESDTKAVMIRADVSDPSTASSTLAKVATFPPAFSGHATRVIRRPGGLYAVGEPGSFTIFGVRGNQLVIGEHATPAQLEAFASAPTSPATGAQGSLAYKIALPALLQFALRTTLPSTVQPILSQLGDITGWTAATTSGMTGSATLALK